MYKQDEINLVPFTEEYISFNYLSWFNDPEVSKFTSHCRWPMTKTRAYEYVKAINHPKSDTVAWAIKTWSNSSNGNYNNNNPTYNHIGNCCLAQIDLINRSAEFGIIIGDKESWGKGISTKVMRIIFGHGFLRLNLNRIWLGTSQSNIGMQQSAIKIGMKREGLYKHALFINGQFEDDFVYSINKYKYFRMNKITIENENEYDTDE
jgi:RimJ/RimL family protein N-acetyltransferase